MFSNIITRYILYDSVVFLIEELKQGLKTLGILEYMKKYPEQFSDIFCKQLKPLDGHMVDLLFIPIFDEEGSNRQLYSGGTTYNTVVVCTAINFFKCENKILSPGNI